MRLLMLLLHRYFIIHIFILLTISSKKGVSVKKHRNMHDEKEEDASQRRIDRLVVFFLEPRDQFGGGQDLGHAADALA